jgi:hypothetical protein
VIYCLDNSSFCCANADGQLAAISKQKDGIFHVVGEIVVVHEITLAAAVTNLKRIIIAYTSHSLAAAATSTVLTSSSLSPV